VNQYGYVRVGGIRWQVKPNRRVTVAVAVCLVFVVGVFVVDPGTTPEPVSFEDTVQIGMSDAGMREAEFEGYEVPSAQVFYSQYSFVVGYTGLESFARNVGERRYERVWGVPTKAYVTDFSGTQPSPVGTGFVETSTDPGWTDASDARYVVGAGPVVAFSSEDDARLYADEHGGNVRGYAEVLETEFEEPDIEKAADEVIAGRSRTADEKVRKTHRLLSRNVSVVVGEEHETVQSAVDAAPPNSSVRVPEGVYREHVVVDKPVTLVGEGDARIVGYGNGTVVTVESDGVAVSSVSISGVGNATRGEPMRGGGWDETIQEAYGRSDAAVLFNETERALVHEVTVDTSTTGVLFSEVDDGVVAGTTVNGTEEWVNGFMGVLAIRSPVVVQNSTFNEGRDGVYSHASDGLVVRRNVMRDGRFGVHLMYTSETLIRRNEASGGAIAGIVIMTRPTSNYIVGNEVRDSRNGLSTVGSRSYFADNVLVNNTNGLRMGARASVFTRNVMLGNRYGASASTVLPSNEVTRNDFVRNEVQVTSAEGAMRVWGGNDDGNYWSNAPPGANVFRPTDRVDSSVTSTDGMVTFRRSTAYSLLHGLDTVVPGMRSGGVVDEDPLGKPAVYDRNTTEDTE
jgi:nitrous oxidase accessory protein NosD/nitrous oxide reductase accessory protein NosL